MAIPAALAFSAPFLAQGLNMLGDVFGARRQQAANMKLAQFQHDRDWDMLQYQLQYNTPANQRKRWEEAGMNPALAYGHGTPGNLESPPRFPNIQSANFQAATADLGTKLMASRLMQSQTDLTNQKVTESGVKQDLMAAQRDLVRANPYFKEEYVSSMIRGLMAAADAKEKSTYFNYDYTRVNDGQSYRKVDVEIDSLVQRFKLMQADQKVKAQIIESKEFQNALLEIQKKWMSDGEITPQHIYQGVMILMQKLMSK